MKNHTSASICVEIVGCDRIETSIEWKEMKREKHSRQSRTRPDYICYLANKRHGGWLGRRQFPLSFYTQRNMWTHCSSWKWIFEKHGGKICLSFRNLSRYLLLYWMRSCFLKALSIRLNMKNLKNTFVDTNTTLTK